MSTKGNHNACFICLRTPLKYPGISLHRFPSNIAQRSLWLKACGLNEEDYKLSRRVCSFHFRKDCFHTTYIRTFLKPGSVPTIFTKQDFEDYKNSVLQENELKKAKKKQKKKKLKKKYKKIKEESSETQSLFCPKTMIRYDNSPNGYKTVWVCRICLIFLFSEDAVNNHISRCYLTDSAETDQDVSHEQNKSNKSTEKTAGESSTSEYTPSYSSSDDESFTMDDDSDNE